MRLPSAVYWLLTLAGACLAASGVVSLLDGPPADLSNGLMSTAFITGGIVAATFGVLGLRQKTTDR